MFEEVLGALTALIFLALKRLGGVQRRIHMFALKGWGV